MFRIDSKHFGDCVTQGASRRQVAHLHLDAGAAIGIRIEAGNTTLTNHCPRQTFPSVELVELEVSNLRIPLDRKPSRSAHNPAIESIANLSNFANMRHELREVLRMRPVGEDFVKRCFHVDCFLNIDSLNVAVDSYQSSCFQVCESARDNAHAESAGD